jgi:hypothetical protein
MASAPAPEPAPEFTPAQQETIRGFAGSMKLAGFTILALGLVCLGIGGYTLLFIGFWSGVLLVLVGALTAFVGIALATGSVDAHYIVETKGYEKDHLANALVSVDAAYMAVTILGALLCVVYFFRLF